MVVTWWIVAFCQCNVMSLDITFPYQTFFSPLIKLISLMFSLVCLMINIGRE